MLRKYGLLALTALAVILAFPPFSLSPLIGLSMTPWYLHVARLKNARTAFKDGLLLGFVISLGTYYWIAYTLHQFAGLPWIAAAFGMLLFCVFCQFQLAVFGWFSFHALRFRERLKFPPVIFWLLLGCSYAAIDWLTPKLFRDTFSQALWSDPIHRQLAEPLGIFGATTLVIAFSGLALDALYDRRKAGHALLFLVPFSIFGAVRYQQVSGWEREAPSARAAVIQANIGDFEKLASERGVSSAAESVVGRYLSLSSEAIERSGNEGDRKPDFVVWPETAYPSTFGTPANYDEANLDFQLYSWVKDYRRPLIFGGYDRKDRKDYNSVFFLSPSRPDAPSQPSRLQTFHKHILLTFGESIPFADTFPWLLQQFPQVGQFGRGPGAQVFEVGDERKARIAPVICYEVLVDRFVEQAAKLAPHFFLNVTNDSWYGRTSEPSMHLALSGFRSIENRIPILRATNTGYTALILPSGRVEGKSRLFEAQTLFYDVPLREPDLERIRVYASLRLAVLALIFIGASFLVWRLRRLSKNK